MGNFGKNYYEKEATEKPLWGTLREVALADNILSLLPTMDADLSLIDIGCGDGFLSINLAKYSKKIFFFDLSLNRLRNVRSNTGQYGLINGDIKSLPFADNSFDFVICSEVLEHIHDYLKALDELVRIARRLIIITVPHRQIPVPICCPQCNHKFYLSGHINYFTGNELARVIFDKGFIPKIKRFHTIYSYNRITLRFPRIIRVFCDGIMIFFSGLISFLKPNYVAIAARKIN